MSATAGRPAAPPHVWRPIRAATIPRPTSSACAPAWPNAATSEPRPSPALVNLGAADHQAVLVGGDIDHRPVVQVAAEQLAGDGIDQFLLQDALQRPGPIDRVVAALGQPV